MQEQLLANLKKNGLEGSIVSIEHLKDLQDEIENWHRQAVMDEQLYNECLSWLIFHARESLPDARSIITVAIPDPQTRVVFTWNKQTLPFIVPPTYLHWQKINARAKEILAKILLPAGYQIAPTSLPVKLLTVHGGLGQYGKNNVCYIANKGSFHRLAGFYTDLPCTEDMWQELKSLPRCAKCSVCVKSCPTGAITDERFLIRAELCISYHNEKPGDIPFPAWLKSSWHNCLVGCLICQKVCPENKNYLQSIRQGATFTQKETELLLKEPTSQKLPVDLEEKLKECDLMGLLDIIPRNLRALLHLSK